MKAAHRLAGAAAIAALAAALGAAPAQAQHSYYPYTEEDLAFTDVAPGDSVEVNPRFLQEDPLPADTAAVVVTFGGSGRGGWPVDGAEATAGYDNCKRITPGDNWNGVSCYFLDPPDLPGEILTLTGPVEFHVDEGLPGPLAACACSYSASVIDADELAWQIGAPDWDPGSPNLLHLTTADAWDGPGDGRITIETTASTYDLAVDPITVAGSEGDEAQTAFSAANLGPANAPFLHPDGSYTVRGQLPGGLDLVSLESNEHWECLDPADLAAAHEAAETALDRFDFACTTNQLDAGDEYGLSFTVRIADAGDTTDGAVEIDAVRDEGVPLLDGDLANNTAAFTLDADAPAGPAAKLPETGAPLSGWLAAAGATLATGAALLVLARRRSPA
ncbi:LPXTG cell wall anchor domain-containing protein [Glycomyces artemisiae]|uniref:LPXTG-motif cell wall-anchored protein n=1 Tax=Glycomyces artemisiae TaxID=1076443 RepID=A0A2T0UMF6_9ACTN|nr:LPXTG cell wall anchor domain-containing protein [Glycomyces artemisiae]PRY59123.1 LPXTG-motif cell wall-anchored protein [Glycomyces artemisiae]